MFLIIGCLTLGSKYAIINTLIKRNGDVSMTPNVSYYSPEQFEFYTKCLSKLQIKRVCDLIKSELGDVVTPDSLQSWLKNNQSDTRFDILLNNQEFLEIYNEEQEVATTKAKSVLNISTYQLNVLVEYGYLDKDYREIENGNYDYVSHVRLFTLYNLFYVNEHLLGILNEIKKKRKKASNNKLGDKAIKKEMVEIGRNQLPKDAWHFYKTKFPELELDDLDFIMAGLFGNVSKKYPIELLLSLCHKNDLKFYVENGFFTNRIFVFHTGLNLYLVREISQNDLAWLREHNVLISNRSLQVLPNNHNLYYERITYFGEYRTYYLEDNNLEGHKTRLESLFSPTYLKSYRKFL